SPAGTGEHRRQQVLKDGAGTAEGMGGKLAVRTAAPAGVTGDAVILGLAVHVGNAELGELVLDVGVHFHFSLVLSGGLFRACG
ncbi:MAG TPA: hypothetical protein VFQ68_33725, partial [Streptosporangiaceae bacterium]|nr:hypothetical protein [Streptosporangiaceae bacterium]